MRKMNKASILTVAWIIWICCFIAALLILPSTAMAEENQESGQYPARQYIYIVDCSGSMEDFETMINMGRTILMDLLPVSSTVVVAFNEQAFLADDGVQFGGNTSVLAGLRLADQTLEDIWATAPDKEVTVILLSDMRGNVSAEDGVTVMTDEISAREGKELLSIGNRWSQYILERKLNFFSLRWKSGNDESSDGVHYVVFSPVGGNYMEFSVPDIIRTCIEAYSCVLTGTDEFHWMEVGRQKDRSFVVTLEESYRTFLYLSAIPEQIRYPNGESRSIDQIPFWEFDSGECLVMLESIQEGDYELICSPLEDSSADTAVYCLQIPFPRFNIEISPKKLHCFSPITISANVTAGKSYLDYNSGNGSCIIKIDSPGEDTPQLISAIYDAEKLCYTATVTPQTPGEYNITATLYDLDNTVLMRNATAKVTVEPFTVELFGQYLRAYNALSAMLENMIVDDEVDISLSNYYSTQFQTLRFIVDKPENQEIATWEEVNDNEGRITVKAIGPGVSELHYRIDYYDFGSDTLNASKEYTMTIRVARAPSRFGWIAVIAGCTVVLSTGIVMFVWYRKKHTRGKDGG